MIFNEHVCEVFFFFFKLPRFAISNGVVDAHCIHKYCFTVRYCAFRLSVETLMEIKRKNG